MIEKAQPKPSEFGVQCASLSASHGIIGPGCHMALLGYTRSLYFCLFGSPTQGFRRILGRAEIPTPLYRNGRGYQRRLSEVDRRERSTGQ